MGGGQAGSGGYVQMAPPQLGETGSGPLGRGTVDPDRDGGSADGPKGARGGHPHHKTRRLGPVTPVDPLGTQGLQGGRADGEGEG